MDGGTLVLGNANALGSTAGGITVASGATLDLGGQAIGANPLSASGTGVGGLGALVNNSNSAASFAGSIGGTDFSVGGVGDITLSGSFNLNATLTKVGGNTVTLSGIGGNLLKNLTVNSGTVVLAKTNRISIGDSISFGENLVVNGGVVQLGGSGGNQIDDQEVGQVFSRAAFDTNGQSENFLGLELEGTGIAGTGALLNSAAGASILNVQMALFADTTIGVTQSAGSLTLNGPISETSGSQALTKVGAGTLVLGSSSNSFNGGLAVQQGTLQVPAVNNAGSNGPLGNNTSVVLGTAGQSGAGQPIGTLEYTGGTASSTMPFTMPASNGAIQIDNASTNLTLTGTIGVSGEFIKAGPGTLELTANPTFNANSVLLNNGGTLRFTNSGAATIGTGVSATVAAGATLELAGSVSALSSGSHRVNISNSSNSPGLLVSGTHQQVGNIDGSGTAQVNAGSDLMANHIVQSVLVIGGAAGSPASVTIAASDALGNPLPASTGSTFSSDSSSGELVSATSLAPSGPFNAGDMSSATTDNADLAVLAMGNSVRSDNPAPVPEPSTLLLALAAVLGVVSTQFARHRST